MILAFDTYYFENKAKTVCVAFNNWSDKEPFGVSHEILEGIEDYEPGLFYKRELPCILSLLREQKYADVEAIVVDGFAILDDSGKNGLGGHLFEELGGKVPIIGVAKSGFHSIKKNVMELIRGGSVKPLYITAKGMTVEQAYKKIESMHGNYRMPTLLKLLDAKTREEM